MPVSSGIYIFFDGYCVTCNWLVDFILNQIIKKKLTLNLKMGSLQSENVKIFLSANHFNNSTELDSVILYMNGQYYTESDAIIKILEALEVFYFGAKILTLVPKRMRDFFYQLFAKNRYRLFGKLENCRVPSENDKNYFM